MLELTDPEQIDTCLSASEDAPIFIFKRSTACGISASAYRRVEAFDADAANACPPVYLVKVIESRPLSNDIAQRLSVRHQSPQLILVRKREAVWSTSHHDITGPAMAAALKQYQKTGDIGHGSDF